MNCKYEIITPSVAKAYLEKNIANYRRIDKYRVACYAKEMANGTWQNNGEAIKFGKDGQLLDGQHRLTAIIRSGACVGMYVIRDVDATLFDCIRPRTTAQTAKASGLSGACVDTQAISAFAIIIRGSLGYAKGVQQRGLVVEYAKANASAFNDMANCGVVSGHCLTRYSPVVLACWCLYLSGISVGDLAAFIKVVNTGFPVVGKDDSSPAIVLRNMLINRKGRAADDAIYRTFFSATIDAFNDFQLNNHRVQTYKFNEKNVRYFNRAVSVSNIL